MAGHIVDDRMISNHEQSFRDLYSGVNDLKTKSGQYMTIKAGITFFLGTLVSLASTFMGMSYMQNQTFLEIRKQDLAEATVYRAKTDIIIHDLSQRQTGLVLKLDSIKDLQREVRTKLKLTGK